MKVRFVLLLLLLMTCVVSAESKIDFKKLENEEIEKLKKDGEEKLKIEE